MSNSAKRIDGRVREGHAMPRKLFVAALFAAVTASSAQAQGTVARVLQEADVRAGPAPDYPLVAHIAPGAATNVHGCLDDFAWCDVLVEGARGWMPAAGIEATFESGPVTVDRRGRDIGIPVVEFDLLAYWSRHYPDQPWYDERERWARTPRINRQHWPQFPGQPPIVPPPPPPPPPAPPKRPLSPGG